MADTARLISHHFLNAHECTVAWIWYFEGYKKEVCIPCSSQTTYQNNSLVYPEEGSTWWAPSKCFMEEGERKMATQAGVAKVLEAE